MSAITREEMSQLLDTKLEPILNEITSMRTDITALKTHVDSINTRLYKLEARVASIDTKLDRVLKNHLETA